MRNENWQIILNEHIEEARKKKMQWGTHDCALWTADYVNKVLNIDFSNGLRGKYKTEIGAQRKIRKLGYKSLKDLVDSLLDSIDIKLAQRGDIVLHDGRALGICNGRFSYVLAEKGTYVIPTLTFTKAWRV